MITLNIVFFRRHDVAFGAEMNTELTLLAKFLFNLDRSFHNISPDQFLPVNRFLERMLSCA